MATPRPEELQQFRSSPLGQRLQTLNSPSETLKQLTLKRRQYEEIQRQSDLLQTLRLSRVTQEVNLEKAKIYRMPKVKKSPRDKRKRNAASRVSTELAALGEEGRESPALVVGMKGFWRKVQGDIHRPESREGASFLSINQRVYLLGGSNRSIYNDLWVFFPQKSTWIRGEAWGVDPEPRMGHSAVSHNSQIVVFGGVTTFNRGTQSRGCLNTVKILRTEGMEWKQVDTAGECVVMRRYHSASMVGKHMLVYGGLSEKNAVLGDLLVLSMENYHWNEVKATGEGPGPLAFHTSVAVYPGFNSDSVLLYRTLDEPFPPPKYPIQIPGVYLFGGLTAAGLALNSLYILETNQRPLHWTKPAVSGLIPSPRFHHSLSLCPELNGLVLFGGRNNTSFSGGYSCFSDVCVLDLTSLTWTELNCQGEVPVSRCAHAGVLLNLQLIVFGGVDGMKYCSGDTFILELDQKVAVTCIRERQRQIQRMEHMKARERSTGSRLHSRSHMNGNSLSLSRTTAH